MNFIFSWQKTIFYERAQRVSKILFCHSKIEIISSRYRVISSIYTLQRRYMVDSIINGRSWKILFICKMKVFGTQFVQTSCQTTVKIKSGMGLF